MPATTGFSFPNKSLRVYGKYLRHSSEQPGNGLPSVSAFWCLAEAQRLAGGKENWLWSPLWALSKYALSLALFENNTKQTSLEGRSRQASVWWVSLDECWVSCLLESVTSGPLPRRHRGRCCSVYFRCPLILFIVITHYIYIYAPTFLHGGTQGLATEAAPRNSSSHALPGLFRLDPDLPVSMYSEVISTQRHLSCQVPARRSRRGQVSQMSLGKGHRVSLGSPGSRVFCFFLPTAGAVEEGLGEPSVAM